MYIYIYVWVWVCIYREYVYICLYISVYVWVWVCIYREHHVQKQLGHGEVRVGTRSGEREAAGAWGFLLIYCVFVGTWLGKVLQNKQKKRIIKKKSTRTCKPRHSPCVSSLFRLWSKKKDSSSSSSSHFPRVEPQHTPIGLRCACTASASFSPDNLV